jgi:hypothetical protein
VTGVTGGPDITVTGAKTGITGVDNLEKVLEKLAPDELKAPDEHN